LGFLNPITVFICRYYSGT